MVNRFSELRNKEIIHVCEGTRLGYLNDVCIDTDTGRVTAIMVPGPCRFLGLFGRDSDAGLTRAQFAKIVVGSLGLTPEYRGTFKDVAEAAWYAPFVDTAAAYGIVNGVGDGKFHPDGAITVQEAATMTARAAALCGIDTALDRLDTPLSAYRDASRVSSWAKASVAYCVSSGLWASGEAALTPSRRISRGEIAQMLYGLLLSANLLQ